MSSTIGLSCETSPIESLPAEIIRIIIDLLLLQDIRTLSCVSKPLRQECLPSLFRQIEIEFSPAGFKSLKSLPRSDVRYHVASFTYVVPVLLNMKILEFDRFKSNILTPDNYVRLAKNYYDDGYAVHEYPSYMVIYDTVLRICQKQRGIVDESADLTILSSTLEALPRLEAVGLYFGDTIERENWFLPEMTMAEESHKHHIQVITTAIQSAKRRRAAISIFSLSWFRPPYYGGVPDLSSFSESLGKLVKSVSVLHLAGSGTALETLSHCALNLRQLEICSAVVELQVLKNFLKRNRSIQSISFHNVNLTGLCQLTEGCFYPYLPVAKICSILDSSQFTLSLAVCRGCPLSKNQGWRVLLNRNCLRSLAGISSKRKFDDE